MCWYLIYTKPKNEDILEYKFKNIGLDVLNPKIKKIKKIRNQKKEILQPLFPCYIFIKADLKEHFNLIRFTRGVIRFIGGDIPTVVPDEIIESIISRMEDGVVKVGTAEFKKGDTVLIKDGPLKDFIGVFDEEIDAKERVSIILRTLSYQVRISVEKDMIEKIKNSSP